MDRRQKLFVNTIIGFFSQILTISCGFIIPRFMLTYYGSSVNGLVSSIIHFLGFISFLEMGMGSVISANLYKPLAEKNTEQLSIIVKAAKKFFRNIGMTFGGYIFVLMLIFPRYINSEFEPLFSRSLILVISLSTFAQYFSGITYQLVLDADQKVYVNQLINVIVVVLNTIVTIVLMKQGAAIQSVKLFSSLIYIIRALVLCVFVKRLYHLRKDVYYKEEPLKQKWNGVSQHFASVVNINIDAVILTLFSTLNDLSVYSVYFAVVNGIHCIIRATMMGMEAFFGSILVENEKELLQKNFIKIQIIVHMSVTTVFTIAAILVIPFVKVYTRGVSDANYIVPVFGLVLILAYGIECIKIPYFLLIKAAGHFKETQWGIFISAIINIVLSMSLVIKFGLIGTALGTLFAMIFSLLYCAFYLSRQIIRLNLKDFFLSIFADIIVGLIAFMVCKWLKIELREINYFSWFFMAVKVTIITIFISLSVHRMLYKNHLIQYHLIKKKCGDQK